MKRLKHVFLTLLVFSLLMTAPAFSVLAEEETTSEAQPAAEEQLTADNLNYDVIFAIDGSGSMKKSDAQKLRLTAGNLFTELAASNTSRAGYVQFTNVIMQSVGLTDLSSEENKSAFRSGLSGLPDAVKGSWDTDISLGLTEALRLLKDGGSFGNDRNPMIILISDGNTDLPSGPRTVEESNAELVNTLGEAAQLGVPVYSIGLNWDGKLDTANMQNIADTTGGQAYNITTASQFNDTMTSIFGNVADGESTELNPRYENGRYITDFVIDNSSVLAANIVILTNKGVSDPKLTDPNGNDVPLDADHNVVVTQDAATADHPSTYTILKLLYPLQGPWQVSVQGDAEDAVQINLLTTYDIGFVLSGSEKATAGTPTTVTGSLIRGDEVIKDGDLLTGSSATITIVDSNAAVVVDNLPMTYDADNMNYTFDTTLPESGNYYVTAKLEGKDGSFSKESGQFKLTLDRAPLNVLKSDVSTTLWCTPIKTTYSENISKLVESEDPSELNCAIAEGSKAALAFNKDTGELKLTPLSTGKDTIKVTVSDNFGQSTEVTFNLNILPSWIWFAIGAAVLALLIILILLIKKKTKPVLKDKVTVELALPPMLASLTPSPATIVFPNKTSEILLSALIQGDQMARETMSDALMQSGMTALIGKVKLAANKDGSIAVKILPKTPGVIVVNNQSIETKKGFECALTKRDKLNIQYSMDGNNSATISLKLGDDSNGFGGGGTFGDGQDPFGGGGFGGGQNPFGGGQGGSPFGGDSGFGGGSSPFGGAGGFGGGSDAGFGSGAGNGGFGGGSNSGFGAGQGNGGFGGGQSNGGFGGGSGSDNGSGFGSGSDSGANSGGGFGGGQSNGGFGGGSGSDNGSGFGSGSDSGANGGGGFGGGQGNSGFDFGGGSGSSGSDDGFGGFF